MVIPTSGRVTGRQREIYPLGLWDAQRAEIPTFCINNPNTKIV